MTRKYLYIICRSSMLSTADRFLIVSVSHGTRHGLLERNFLTQYAARNGHFFAVWSAMIDDFLCKCEKSLMMSLHGSMTICKARDLIRHFKTGNPLNLCPGNAGTISRFLSATNPAFYFQSRLHAHLSSAM